MTAQHPNLRHSGLDTLRALAIVAVMFFHRFWQVVPDSAQPAAHQGWMGVDLFFVLSGYLIGSQLLRPAAQGHTPQLWQFYRKRLFRVLPAYLVVLALYFLWPLWREESGISPLWQFLTFTENLFVDYSVNHAFSHVWSLCVEEHFYLFLPLIGLLFLRKPRFWKAAALLISLTIVGVLIRSYVLIHTLQPLARDGKEWTYLYMEQIYYPTWCRLDGLLAGVTLALIQLFRPAWWIWAMRRGHSLTVAAVGLIALAVWLLLDRFESPNGRAAVGDVIGFPILSIGLGLLVASALSRNGLLSRVRVPGAKTIAILAYSLYLTHKEAYDLAAHFFANIYDAHGWPWIGLSMASCLAVAATLYLAIERPFLVLRDRNLARPKTPVETVAETEPAL